MNNVEILSLIFITIVAATLVLIVMAGLSYIMPTPEDLMPVAESIIKNFNL
jgi:hypothetical protein